MNKAAQSVFYFGIYLALLGLALLIKPNFILGMFGMPETSEIWIRVVGMLVLLLAVYYTQMGRQGLVPFLWITVYARMAVIVFFTAFVLIYSVSPMLILFGAVDFLGALWTLWALKKE